MNKRQASVLEHIVVEYVHTVRPVGSIGLSRRLNVSSATIRNVMSELDEMGYVEKHHHSAGRMPTDRGYRFFVDSVISEVLKARKRSSDAVDSLESIRFSLDELLKEVTRRLSETSNCLSFISVPEEDMSEIRKIELARVSAHGMLIIMVLGNGMVENRLIELPTRVEDLPLDRFARALNSRLCGMKTRNVTPAVLESLFLDIRLREEFLAGAVIAFFADIINSLGRKVYIEGALRLMDHPEFQDPRKLRPVIDSVESERSAGGLFAPPPSTDTPCVTIGREHGIDSLFDCSSIKRNFYFGDRTTGSIGIIGPRRMEYPGLLNLVECFSASLGSTLEKLSRLKLTLP